MKFTPDAMKKRYHLASAEAAAIRAKTDPMRAVRDAMVAEHDAKVRELNAAIAKLEASLFDLDRERGMMVKIFVGANGAAKMGRPEDFCTKEELEAARASAR